MANSPSIRLGISRCLLGDEVRFDGGHRRDDYLTDLLGRYVEWVPVCPEVEAGLGTPRDVMRLVGDPLHPKLITIEGEIDHTKTLNKMSVQRIRELKKNDLAGYVFKKNSPSCGIEQVRIYNEQGKRSGNGIGLFARSFMEQFPLTPVEDEGRLCDPAVRENFIERVFAYRRWQDFMQGRVTKQALVQFHTIHKYLLMAHSPQQYQALGRLVAQAHRQSPKTLANLYGPLFMKALAVKTTVSKQVNVLHHMQGYFKTRLSAQEKSELSGAIDEYRRELTPLLVPLTLIKHYTQIFEVNYLRDQIYLDPHPSETMLRNHA